MRKLFLILMAVIACTWSVSAQNRTIHGTVLDAGNHEPLIGATVMPIGGGQGTATDIDGNFTLNIPANVKKANVSYVGYKSKEVTLQNGMHIELESTSTNLDDVVVVAYGTANKESLTGSVAVVGSKEIDERPVMAVTAALEGNAPGVQVNNSTTQPGESPAIRVRGFNSINGNQSPLYVVDGAIYEGSIAELNPNDIESMSVLKDAASCALYGAKGANGVILITTKKAKGTGKVDVTLSINQGIYSLGLPMYSRMDANDWMQYSFIGVTNGAVSSGAYATLDEARAAYRESFINSFAKLNIYGVADNALFDEAGVFVGGNPLPGYDTDRDWWKSVSRTGHRQDYNVSAAAASEKYNVFASVGYAKENGYTLKTDYERFSSRVNANFAPTTYFNFGLNVNGTHTTRNYSSNAGDNSTANLFNVMGVAPIYPYYAHDVDGTLIREENGDPKWNTAGYLQQSNPGYTLRMDRSDVSSTIVDGLVYGDVVLPYGFDIRITGSIHRDKTTSSDYTNPVWGSGQPLNGIFAVGYQDFRTHQFQQALTWSKEYGLHHIDALFNHENHEMYMESNSTQMADEMFANVYNLSNFSEYRYASGGISEVRSERYLGRARYNYDQKYFGEVSFTREGSSRFAKNNRWGNFWSIGGSWIISKEKFMQNLMWLDYLKLRAAYGAVGNDESAGYYAYWSLFSPGREYGVGTGMATLVPAQIAANNIKWESTKTLDLALEGSVFNDRLQFTIGYFDKRNADLLFNVTQPASAGSYAYGGYNLSIMNNIGTMSNRGWELQFTGTVMRNKDIDWTVSLDATFLQNKIVKLPMGRDIQGFPYIQTEGRSLYEFYMYKWEGVDQLTGRSVYLINPESHEFWDKEQGKFDVDAYNDKVEGARADGSLIEYNGKTYTYKTNFATKEFLGSALPKVYGSFGTNFSWKGLHVGMLFTYGIGGQVNDGVYAGYMSFGNSPGAMHVDLKNSWTAAPEGMTEDSPNRFDTKGVPQLNSELSMENNTTSSRWLTDASYLVFKNLNISYDLPQKWVAPLQLQNINIGMAVDNLFTATQRKGMNPQYSYSGGQGVYFGTARVWSFSLTAKF